MILHRILDPRHAALLVLSVATQLAAQTDRLAQLADAIVESHVPALHDPDALVARLIDAARADPRHPAAAAALVRASGMIDELREPARALTAVLALRDVPSHGATAHSAKLLHRSLLRAVGRRDEARALDVYADFATHFVVIGPFGDSGSQYTGVAFDPEFAFPPLGTQVQGRFRTIEPRLVERKAHRPDVPLLRRDRDRENGVCYALHRPRVDTASASYVEIDARGSFELFVNSEPVHTELRAIAERPRICVVPIRLAAGTNHVLIKTTDLSTSTLSLRYLDAAGHAIVMAEDRTAASIARTPSPAASADVPTLPPFVDATIALHTAMERPREDATATQRDTLALATALIAQQQGHGAIAMHWVAHFDTAPPSDARLRLALAVALERTSAIPDETRVGRVRQLVESTADELADHHERETRVARLAADEDRVEDAIRAMRDRVARHPDEAASHHELVEHLEKIDLDPEALAAQRRWHERVPDDPRPTLALAQARARNGAAAAALEMLLEGLRLRPAANSLRNLAFALATELGAVSTRDRLFDEIFESDPDDIDALRTRAAALHEAGSTAEALALDEAIVAHADANAQEVASAGANLLAAGRTDAARAAFERALELDPSRHATRRGLATMRGETEPFAALAEFGRDGDAAIAAFEPTERETTSISTLVLDQIIVQFFADGSSVQQVHTIRRINDLRGVDAHEEATAAARADEVIRLRTVGKDGSDYVPNRVRGSFAMPRLEPGAFIEQIYRDFRGAPEAEPWRSVEFTFQSADEPYVLSEYVVILPPQHPGSFRMRRFEGETESRELADGSTAHVFRVRDMARLATESLAPPLADLVPIVGYGEDGAVAADARLGHVRARYFERSSPWVRARVAEVLADVPESDLARAQALYDWCHATIPQSNGRPDPTAILLLGQGPRFYLWVAMLRDAGVPFTHALTASMIDGMRDTATPLFQGDEELSLAAVRVEPRDAEAFWVWADNARYQPMGLIAPERFGAPALLLSLGRHERITLPGGVRPTDELGWKMDGEIRLDAAGTATFELRAEKRGDTGYILADQIRDLPQNHRSVAARQIPSQIVPGWTVTDSSIVGLLPGERLVSIATLQRRNAIQTAGERAYLALPMPALELTSSLADRQSRTLPIESNALGADAWRITIDDSEAAFRIVAVPHDFEVHTTTIDYALRFCRDEQQRLVIERELVQRPGTIPAAEYAEWQRVLRAIDAAELQKITLAPR